MKFTEQDKIDWESGKCNEMTNYKEDDEDCETYNKVVYYPEADATVWLYCFFEGYYNDDMVDQFQRVSKGRAPWDKVADYLREYDDED